MAKLIPEARIAAIVEFQARLVDAATAYAQLALDCPEEGHQFTEASPTALAPLKRGDRAQSRAPTGQGWPGRHDGRTAPRPAGRYPPLGDETWAEVTVSCGRCAIGSVSAPSKWLKCRYRASQPFYPNCQTALGTTVLHPLLKTDGPRQ